MKIFVYDEKTFEFICEDNAQLDPLETAIKGEEVFLIPAHSTSTPPKTCEENSVNIFNPEKNEWEIVKDFRGTVVYNKKTCEEHVISELGDIPANFVLEKPFNLQIGKIEGIKEIDKLYKEAYSKSVKLGKISVTLEERNDLLRAYEGLDEEHNKFFYDTNEEAILLTKDELKEVLDLIYTRSIELPELKNEFIKKVKACRSKSGIDKVIEEATKKIV